MTTGDCVGVLPFVDPETVLLIRQYRYVARRITGEMPTGGVHAGEWLEQAAQRELGEEIGYRAGRLRYVCTYHTSTGPHSARRHRVHRRSSLPVRGGTPPGAGRETRPAG